LKKEYKDQDLTQQVSSRAYLEAFKDKPRTDNSEVLQFCRDYSEISKELLGKGKLDKYTQLRWFLQGLPPSIQSELFNHYNIDLDGDAVPDFEGILNKAYSLIETRKKMVELGTTDIKNDRMSDLVDRSAKKTQLAHPFSGPSTLSDFVFQVPVVPTAPLISASPSQNDKKIDNLTDMMRSLALSVRTLQGSTNALLLLLNPNPNLLIRLLSHGCVPITEGQVLEKAGQRVSIGVFQDDLNSGRIHLGDEDGVCLGAYSPGARPVCMRREKPGRESVADAEKLRYPPLPPANVQTLRIGEVDPDPYSSDEETEYISLDEPVETGPVKRILRRRIEKENNYVAPKNVRFGEWEPVKDSSLPDPTPTVPSSTQEEVMPDVEGTTAKKPVERKKHPRVVNVLKESAGPTNITKRILDLGVSLTVGELLASAPAVEKQLTKAISEDEAVQFRVNSVDIGNPVHIKDSWHSMGSPKIKVRLEDGPKVRALLDTGAEINVMTSEVMEDAGLAMRKGPKLELVSHTGHSRPFLGLCEDVEVAIGGLKTRHPIFVVEHGDHDLVLGQPFLNTVKFRQEYKPEGVFGTITHPQSLESAVFRTLSPQDPANRTANQIFPFS
ncbi:hypothetical protein MMC31_005833, partial [Peltigera leucophlebia]|nr:hypothetical protein [Peltigera leucophlebia]